MTFDRKKGPKERGRDFLEEKKMGVLKGNSLG